MTALIYPDHPDFYPILHSALPPGWRERVDSDFWGTFAVREDSLLLEPMSDYQVAEYLSDGEYDRLEWLEDDAPSC
jgi:hypothetical protein